MPQEQKPILTPEKKNSTWWIWLILGFVIILFLTLLVAGGYFGLKLTQEIQNKQTEIENIQKETQEQYSELEEKSIKTEKELEETKKNLEKEQKEKVKLEKEKEEEEEEEKKEEGEEKTTEEEKTDPCDLYKDAALRKTDTYGIFGDDEFDTIVCGYIKMEEEEVFGEKQTTAYFVITKYSNSGFRESIVEGIKGGNSVNKKIGNLYALNLGCQEGSKITGIQYTDEVYINDETTSKIFASSKENPIPLIVSFDIHAGADCSCCNLASKIRPY